MIKGNGIWVLCPVFLIASDFLISRNAKPLTKTTNDYARKFTINKINKKA